jgi:hypothetical protein
MKNEKVWSKTTYSISVKLPNFIRSSKSLTPQGFQTFMLLQVFPPGLMGRLIAKIQNSRQACCILQISK